MTNKPLKRIASRLFYFDNDDVKHNGANPSMSGDCIELRGDCSGLRGNCSGLRGDCTELVGDCTGLVGDCSGLRGNLDDITPEQRKYNPNIQHYAEVDNV